MVGIRIDRRPLWAALACAGALVWGACGPQNERADLPPHRPIELPEGGYVGSDTCRACHPQAYDTWHASFHRTMTQEPSPETVRGDFDGLEQRLWGKTWKLERTPDGRFWIDMPGAQFDGRSERVKRPVVLVTGSHHMQIYWFETGRDRELGQHAFVWLIEEERWIPRVSAFLAPHRPNTPPENGRWNHTCIQCHTTDGRPRLTATRMDTEVSEFGIACEACHGPGAEHVAANRDPGRRYAQHLEGAGDDTIAHPGRLDPLRSSQVCGQCHGISWYGTEERDRFLERGYSYRPGDDLSATRHVEPDPLNRFAFWSDGMVRVSGREYNGLLESPCYQALEDAPEGFGCTTCHSLHRDPDDDRPLEAWTDDMLRPGMRTNDACASCHPAHVAEPSAHTRHAAGSSGSLCYNCHMPYTTYGLLKAIRSHEISNPSAQETLEVGRPNACNQCHLDKPLAWTAEHLHDWYGIAPPALDADHREIAQAALFALRGDAGQRALTAWAMGWDDAKRVSGSDWQAPYLAQLLVDPYDAVRFIAARSLRRLEPFADFEYDFADPPEARSAATREAFQRAYRARRARPSGREDPAAVLLRLDLRLRSDAFSRLLRQRDDTSVELHE